MYEVWYRAGAGLHWWKLPHTDEDGFTARAEASAIEAALKQVGFNFPQAEVRASGELVQQDDATQGEYASESEVREAREAREDWLDDLAQAMREGRV